MGVAIKELSSLYLIGIIILTVNLAHTKELSENISFKEKSNESQPWSFKLSTGISSDLYKDENTIYNSFQSLNISRKHSNKISSNFLIIHDYRLSEYEEENNKNSKLKDIKASLLFKDLIKTENYNISGSTGVIFANSKQSQDSSKNGSIFFGVNQGLSFEKFYFFQNNIATVNSYEYKTPSKRAATYNEKFGVLNSLGLNYSFTDSLSIAALGSLYTSNSYADDQQQFQIYSVHTNYNLKNNLALILTFNSKDKIITNNSLFDETNSSYQLEIAYDF